ncbi:ABC transporter substrate-binding protein [Streptomyces sparsogenes]|uniref:Extracellular solute-binding protein n=1 Tax=Streptomyces sparsogenes DSM 40356 TaxID=1331668 RepID=A0A1R1SMK3_9ACTN|nr:ABC transporter substrate-binding protein [Streptomyces sparsogenes]OMI39545.1 extracellular solute-binding protein [Streptomyces sparsogenes DSM 40356]
MSAATRPNVTAAVLALWLVLLCALGTGDAGAQRSGGTIRVLASWTGSEEDAFRQVLDAFTAEHHIRVEYQGTTALREVLLSEVRSGTPPDIAVLPSSGELTAYAANGYLAELGPVVPEGEYTPLWTPRLTENGPVYGIAVKADLKGIVWYDGTRHRPRDLPALAADGRQWCVGMGDGATSGWPGTDWIEDILLRQQGKQVYERWATGELAWDDPRVARAWRTWGELFSGAAAKAALGTDFRAAGKQLFAKRPPCALEHQGSFIRGSYPGPHRARFGFSSDVLGPPRPPGGPGGAHEVSGDFAALFKNTGHTEQARELLRYLAGVEGQRTWAEHTPPGSARPFSANSEVPVSVQRDDRIAQSIARTLQSSSLCLDASDAMPPRMRLAFQRAVLTFLSYPDADKENRLGPLLGSLEKVHRSTEQGGDEHQPWPSTVCR